MIYEFDDFGASHQISDMCMSNDCRDVLIKFREMNPKFRVTLFSIPGEMTAELLNWCTRNSDWVEMAVHGFYHTSNYECEKMSYEEFDALMEGLPLIKDFFVKGFRAPGWQISDDIYRWLLDHDWWVADQGYNNGRRPEELKAYVNEGNNFRVWKPGTGFGAYQPAHHGHVWNCVGNGIYEQFDYLIDLVKNTDDFKFVSEVVHGN